LVGRLCGLDWTYLERIDRRERHAEGGTGRAGKDRLDKNGEVDALKAMMPALAAVSPKRESGPWKRAARRPA
jgi:hypothetical protein